MKKLRKAAAAVLPLLALLLFLPVSVRAADGNNMYRLYNPNSGEHFYTASTAERDSLTRAGWDYEGIGWVAPKSGKPVYRLYNRSAGDHHYTASAGERSSLIRAGWKSEGIGWYSGGSVALYRQYNPNARSGSHNYTTSKAENDSLVRAGWRAEGIGWYGIGGGKAAPWSPKNNGDIREMIRQFKNRNAVYSFTMYGQTGFQSAGYSSYYGDYLLWQSTMRYSHSNPYAGADRIRAGISGTLGSQPVELIDDEEQWYSDGVTIEMDSHEWPLKVRIY